MITPLESKEEGTETVSSCTRFTAAGGLAQVFLWLSNAAPTDAVILAVCRNDADSELRQIVAFRYLGSSSCSPCRRCKARSDQVKAT